MSYQYSIYALPNWTMRANRVSVASPSLEFVVQFLQPQLVFAHLVTPCTAPRCADVTRFVYWAYFFLHHFRAFPTNWLAIAGFESAPRCDELDEPELLLLLHAVEFGLRWTKAYYSLLHYSQCT